MSRGRTAVAVVAVVAGMANAAEYDTEIESRTEVRPGDSPGEWEVRTRTRMDLPEVEDHSHTASQVACYTMKLDYEDWTCSPASKDTMEHLKAIRPDVNWEEIVDVRY